MRSASVLPASASGAGTARQAREVAPDRVEIDVLGIEVVAGPFAQLGIFLVARVRQHLEQSQIAIDAAAILRRAGPLARDQRRVGLLRVERLDLLDDDLVLPIVAEVVDVAEALDAPLDQRAELDVAVVVGGLVARPGIVVGLTIAAVADLELMQVVVLPAHRRLDDPVQHVQAAVGGDADPTPDGRPQAAQRDLEDERSRRHGQPPDTRGGALVTAWLQPQPWRNTPSMRSRLVGPRAESATLAGASVTRGTDPLIERGLSAPAVGSTMEQVSRPNVGAA